MCLFLRLGSTIGAKAGGKISVIYEHFQKCNRNRAGIIWGFHTVPDSKFLEILENDKN